MKCSGSVLSMQLSIRLWVLQPAVSNRFSLSFDRHVIVSNMRARAMCFCTALRRVALCLAFFSCVSGRVGVWERWPIFNSKCQFGFIVSGHVACNVAAGEWPFASGHIDKLPAARF